MENDGQNGTGELLEMQIACLSEMMFLEEEKAKSLFFRDEFTATQLHYLETIRRLGNPSLTELAVSLNLTKPTVKITMDKMLEKGIVCKVRSDADRRTTHFHLTGKGQQINEMHDYAHRLIADIVRNRLDCNEMLLLTSLLEKLLRTR